MSDYSQITPLVNQILKKYDLCDHCLGRFFSKQLHLSSNKLLGKKLHHNQKTSKKCHICKNIFKNLNYFLKMMHDASLNYSFSSFSVGTIVKPSIIDRDDCIRSKYRLKGIDGIKTDITKELGKLFAKQTRKIIDNLNPEVVFTVNIKDESCQLRSKSITISGRYVKSLRGIPQKQVSCENCLGKGCRICDSHGISKFDSVEGIISKFLFEKLGGGIAKFTWIGGEDKSSLVLGSGRPFFVKLHNPRKRNLRKKSLILDSLNIFNLKIIPNPPKSPIKFISYIKIKINSDSILNSDSLKKLKVLTQIPVIVYDKSGKRSEKKIYSCKYRKISNYSFSLILKVDGGLPIKRFVIGDDVSPGISKILNASCTCKEFDFLDIETK
ncbi:MAG: tRNA pseudouridine synthase Pus10 [Nitrosopumilus sp.]|nr:tRNA pseudouridine synthase Pus10 [Nitrosopumilus sp.]